MSRFLATLFLLTTAAAAGRDSFTLVDGDRTSSFGAGLSMKRLESLRAEGPVLVCARGGREQVVRAPALISRARAALEPVVKLGSEQAALGGEQARLGARQARLGGLQAELGAGQARRGARQAAAASRASPGAAKSGEGDDQEELAEDQDQLGGAQGTLSDEQEKLGRAQDALGRRQSELGRKQSAAAKEAERQLAAICDEAANAAKR